MATAKKQGRGRVRIGARREPLPIPWDQLDRIIGRLQMWACSMRWVDDLSRAIRDGRVRISQDERGRVLTAWPRLRDGIAMSGIYPPGGYEHTGMRQCRICGRWVPGTNLAYHAIAGVCDDCAWAPTPEELEEIGWEEIQAARQHRDGFRVWEADTAPAFAKAVVWQRVISWEHFD
jgi:hypothetical protein